MVFVSIPDIQEICYNHDQNCGSLLLTKVNYI